MSDHDPVPRLEAENAALRQRLTELEAPEPKTRSFPWGSLLVGMGVAPGALGVLVCGIPFVPPASGLAVNLGLAGLGLATIGVILDYFTRRSSVLLVVIVSITTGLNLIAIAVGQAGRHLLD